MSQLRNKTLFNLILWFSIFALFAAYFVQYILGHLPCNLCLLERIPYFLAIIIIIISFKSTDDDPFVLFLKIRKNLSSFIKCNIYFCYLVVILPFWN